MGVQDKVQDAKAWWKSKTVIGTILFVLPMIIKMIKPELTVDLEAGTDAVFEQADQIAGTVDALWVQVSSSLGIILTALGLRTAKQPLG